MARLAAEVAANFDHSDMRIKRFVSVKNIGRLVDCKQKGPELNRYNLFFAENGAGKTTLCAVLRSLKTGGHEHVTGRTTMPISGDPEVTIKLDSHNAIYKERSWSSPVPGIEIFDTDFVAKNVHAGEYVGRSHRTNLLRVITGETGVNLAKRVDDLDKSIRAKNSQIDNTRKTLLSHLPKDLDLKRFIELEADVDIDDKIVERKVALEAAREAERIKTHRGFSEVAVPDFPAEFGDVLSKKLDDVAADAETRLRNQIDRHGMHERGESWISQGLDYISDDACPFCGQSTKGLDLIGVYKQFFSESYAALVREVKAIAAVIDNALGEATLAGLSAEVAKNESGFEFWEQFETIDIDDIDYENDVAVPLRRLRKEAKSLVERKLENPSADIDPGQKLDLLKSNYESTVKLIHAYNKKIIEANRKVSKQKQAIEKVDPVSIGKEIKDLELIKLRHSPNVRQICTEYKNQMSEKARLDKEKANAKQTLDSHTDERIRGYEDATNKILKGFGAGFLIANSKKSYVGGTPSSVYQPLINECPVDLGDEKTPPGQPSFRTALSAGDKSTLALAFFLARIENDPHKADRIVVFDDPFSSLDRSRRERTAELLKKYGGKCAQLLVFSHEPSFLKLVYDKLPQNEVHSLQLFHVPNNTTTIEEWDVERETQNVYVKDLADLELHLSDGNGKKIDIVRKIRPVLEGHLRRCFSSRCRFSDNEGLGSMIKKIQKSPDDHPMHAMIEELEDINSYSKKYHHDDGYGNDNDVVIDSAELRSYVSRTVSIVRGR